MTRDRLVITASPHLKGKDSTPRIMWNVVGSLVPVVAPPPGTSASARSS